MSDGRKKVAELFRDEKFKAFSIFFFEKPRSITEVGKLSKVSRTTIYKFTKMLREFLETKSSPFQREKLYYLDIRLLCEFYAEQLNLTKEEKEVLLKILSNPDIDSYLRRNNQSWDDVFSRINFLFMTYKLVKKFNVMVERFARRRSIIPEKEKSLHFFAGLLLKIGMEREKAETVLKFDSIIKTVDRNALESLSQKITQDKELVLFTSGDVVEFLESLLEGIEELVSNPKLLKSLIK